MLHVVHLHHLVIEIFQSYPLAILYSGVSFVWSDSNVGAT